MGLILIYCVGRWARKYDGECFLLYLCWYGLGRFWIEGLRTDSLYLFGWELFGVPIRVSQLVAGVCFVVAGALLIYNRFRPHDPAKMYVNRLAAQRTQETPSQAAEDSESEREEK